MVSSLAPFLLLCLVLAVAVSAFQPISPGTQTQTNPSSGMYPPQKAVSVTSTTSLNVFGSKKKKTEAELQAESEYWLGEWVCKDCGYIYNRVSYFERVSSVYMLLLTNYTILFALRMRLI